MSNTPKRKPRRILPGDKAKLTERGRKLAELSDKDLLAFFVANTGPGDPSPVDLYRAFKAIKARSQG